MGVRSLFLLAGVSLVFCAPLGAAPRLVAPDSVSELLTRHLALADIDDKTLNADARVALERRLQQETGDLLATEGYFSPRVALRDSASGLAVEVDPGPQSRIGQVNIEIRGLLSDERRRQLIAGWGLPAAAPFRQAAWNDAKNGLLHELVAVDHATARLLESQADVDVAAARADLTLVYDTGPHYRYGEIRVVGLSRYPRALVERYSAALKPGAEYRQDDLLKVQADLQKTPYFSSVVVDLDNSATNAEGDAPPDEVRRRPVVIRLSERAPFDVLLGTGYSSNTGARVEGNFRNSDFLTRAWELNTGASIEQLRQNVYADVFLPPDREKRQRDSFGVLAEKSDIQGLSLERVALAVARTQTRGSVEQRLGLNWQFERQASDGVPTTNNRALTATTGWVWRHDHNPQDASQGIVMQLQLGAATKAVLSDQNFIRSYFRYSQGILLSRDNSLLLRGEVGVTAAPSRDGIPQDYLFRAGGSNSVRGYDYQSLGVKQGSAVLGGRYLVSLSAEYTHWLNGQWGVATFVDAGQAADDHTVLKLAQGYGVGARWKSPAGPLAVDLAWGQLDHQFRLHFSLAVPF